MHPAETDRPGLDRPGPTTLGLDAARTQQLLEGAARAPSLHNSQPWRFRPGPERLDLLADPRRRLPASDPDGRELRLSCGAALLHLRVGLERFGVRPEVALLPDRTEPDLLATVRRGGTHRASPETAGLWRAVPTRTTNRRPFSQTPVSTPDQHALRRAATAEGARLTVVEDPHQREALARLGAQAHQEQLGDPAYEAELAAWTTVAPGRDDGVPAAAGGPQPHPHERWVHRDFSDGAPTPRRWPRFEAEPLVCVLSTPTGGPAAELAAGQAMERVLLEATVRGLAVSQLSQVIEVPRTRRALRTLLGAAHEPQCVLRIGHGWPTGRTPRRPVAELLVP